MFLQSQKFNFNNSAGVLRSCELVPAKLISDGCHNRKQTLSKWERTAKQTRYICNGVDEVFPSQQEQPEKQT